LTAPRVALIGARRVRQGLGPFVGRFLAKHGATVVGVLGTRMDSARQAAAGLEGQVGHAVPAYVDLSSLVAETRPDALAILSPHESHEGYLAAALQAGLHVLCEKPLLFGGEELERRAASLVDGFRSRRLLLMENCQWPELLPSYLALCPPAEPQAPRSFAMQLSPASEQPRAMLADCLSHPLSMLQSLAPAPGPRLEGVRIGFEPRSEPGSASRSGSGPGSGTAAESPFRPESRPDSRPDSPSEGRSESRSEARSACLRLACDYVAGDVRIRTGVELLHCESIPRPAGFGLNGAWVQREIRLSDYTMYLTAGARSVKVPDPLDALIGRFVHALHEVLSGRPPADPAPVLERMSMLTEAMRALDEMGAAE